MVGRRRLATAISPDLQIVTSHLTFRHRGTSPPTQTPSRSSATEFNHFNFFNFFNFFNHFNSPVRPSVAWGLSVSIGHFMETDPVAEDRPGSS